MDTNLSLFNQINSLSYWLWMEGNFKSSIALDSEKDTYYVNIKQSGQSLYTHRINHYSRLDSRLLRFELKSIVNSLLTIKEEAALKKAVAV